MAEIARWHDIVCECGEKDYFLTTSTYRWHPNGGTSKGLEVIRCLKCLRLIDASAMQQRLRRASLQRQLDEMNEDAGSETPPSPPPASQSNLRRS